MTSDQAGSSSQLPQPAGTTSESQATQLPYQPRTGAYPYAVGSWGYHYPQFPTSAVSPSVTATQGDSVANAMASGTFPYPYTAAQYAVGQSTYVPPIKYPYGAPANPTSAPAELSPSAGTKPTTSTQEQPYNSFLWKQPYTGPRDSTAPAESQAPSESTSSNDAPESTRKADEVLTSSTSNDDIVPPTEVPTTDNPAPTSCTEDVTTLKLHT